MSIIHFQCPSCQAPLRLENRALFVGRTFDCPDCHESLLIEADGSTGVIAKRSPKLTRSASEGRGANVTSPSLALRVSLDGTSKVTDLGVDLQSPSSVWDRLSRRPAVLGWIVAALFAVILLVVVNSGGNRTQPDAAPPALAKNSASEAKTQDSPEQNAKADHEPNPLNEKIPDAANADSPKVEDKPAAPQTEVVVELPRGDKPPAEPGPNEKPTADLPKPIAVPPPPEPAPQTLTAEAVEAKLQQKIARFEQSKPAAFVKVLDTVEELAGVPIVWDLERVDEQHLQKLVTLSLKQTTVAEILDALLKQVGLERRTVEGKIELRPMTVPRP